MAKINGTVSLYLRHGAVTLTVDVADDAPPQSYLVAADALRSLGDVIVEHAERLGLGPQWAGEATEPEPAGAGG